MISNEQIKNLTNAQRALLILHIDGPLPVIASDAAVMNTRRALMSRKLLKDDKPGPLSWRPESTSLTEKGRNAVAAILAEYAEMLIKAGYLETDPDESPLDALKRLKALKSAKTPSFGPALGPKNLSKKVDF